MKKHRFTLQYKILSVTVLIVICLLGFVMIMHDRINTLQRETSFISHQDREIASLANKIEKNILDMETGQRGYIITGDDKYLEPYDLGKAQWKASYDKLSLLNANDSLQLQRLVDIENSIQHWIKQSGDYVIELKKEGQEAEILRYFNSDDGKDQMDQIRSQFSTYRETMNENTNTLIAEQADRNKLLLEFLYIAWAIIAITSVVASWIISRAIVSTIRKVTHTIAGLDSSVDMKTRVEITTNDEIRDLSVATNHLIDMQQERIWIQDHANDLLSRYQGITLVSQLGDIFLSKTAEVIDYPYSALYIRTQEHDQDLLNRTSTFGGSSNITDHRTFQIGEGLVGQCAKEARLMHIQDLPENYINIQSGLGVSAPKSLLLFPVSFSDEVVAVVEIATFSPLTERQIEFLDSISDAFGAAINSTISSMRIDQLLEQSQRLNEELQVYTEELQTQSEELQIQTESLHATNRKLEEKNLLAERKSFEAEQAQIELAQSAELLRQSSQYKSEFLANMSHELRTPLNGILLLSEFLMENQSGALSEEDIEFSQAIHSSGQDLLRLINDILDLSKVEAGKLNIEIEAINLTEIPEAMLQSFNRLSRKKEIPFHIQIGEGLPTLFYSDAQRVRQIIINLLSNAFKFTAKGSVILEIRLATKDELVKLGNLETGLFIAFAIKDTGIGIPYAKQSIIFEAFQQADGNTERQYGGTGLGLSISRELAILLGGRITVESQVGMGSVFTVYLPLKLQDNPSLEETTEKVVDLSHEEEGSVALAAATSENISSDFTSLNHKHVLIVDDDERNLFALSNMLRKRGLQVTTAADGERGIHALEQSVSIDIVLMDIMMPVMNGYEAINRIREIPTKKEIPIIALTAKALKEDKAKILQAGATDYLSKPINLDRLLALMQLLLTSDS
ncbi:two-component system chemotaxis sensor kinase CheA [Paenibacillus sp. PastF-3]|uniref:CHASE3 domain-containing protein n=1 Tax=Paenibacillus sp. PastF-3 TaxID=2940626 RepID=UPI00247589C8|nr:CHASE3 domain-containing protein [Paenibacillus sp. PastF-3]MDH6371240.1 two-component system chemotaxis sensor kinase CheA [Paenibacillus sp. PastF-3]